MMTVDDLNGMDDVDNLRMVEVPKYDSRRIDNLTGWAVKAGHAIQLLSKADITQ
jgi:hypothetical protein